MRLRLPRAPAVVAEDAQAAHAQAVARADLVGAVPVVALQLRGRLPVVSPRLRAVVAAVVAVLHQAHSVVAEVAARRAASRSEQSVKSLSSSRRPQLAACRYLVAMTKRCRFARVHPSPTSPRRSTSTPLTLSRFCSTWGRWRQPPNPWIRTPLRFWVRSWATASALFHLRMRTGSYLSPSTSTSALKSLKMRRICSHGPRLSLSWPR